MTTLPPIIKEAPAEGTHRILLTVSYDGTNYSGWQYQDNAPSVQDALEKALQQALDGLSLNEWEDAWENTFPEDGNFKDILLQLARGEMALDGAGAVESLLDRLLGAMKKSLRRMAGLLLPAIFYGIL